MKSPSPSRGVPTLIYFLIFISLVFIGILIFAYVETKKANPQMLEGRAPARHCVPARRV